MKIETKNKTENQQRNIVGRVALTGAILLSVVAPLFAQQGNTGTMTAAPRPMRNRAANNHNSADILSIVQRAASMSQYAQSRSRVANVPATARTEYQSAQRYFSQMLAASGSRTNIGSINAASNIEVSSSQGEQDIMTLRRAAMSGSRSPQMSRVAELYAQGIRAFFTGQIREALYGTDMGNGNGSRRSLVLHLKPNNAPDNVQSTANPAFPTATPGVDTTVTNPGVIIEGRPGYVPVAPTNPNVPVVPTNPVPTVPVTPATPVVP